MEGVGVIELLFMGLFNLFVLLGNVICVCLDVIVCLLELWSFLFMDLLDNVLLKLGEMLILVLLSCCYNRCVYFLI